MSSLIKYVSIGFLFTLLCYTGDKPEWFIFLINSRADVCHREGLALHPQRSVLSSGSGHCCRWYKQFIWVYTLYNNFWTLRTVYDIINWIIWHIFLPTGIIYITNFFGKRKVKNTFHLCISGDKLMPDISRSLHQGI